MKVAVVGATGMVGSVMLEVLAEQQFPYTELLLVASENSVGKKLTHQGKEYAVIGLAAAVEGIASLQAGPMKVKSIQEHVAELNELLAKQS